MRMSPAVGTLKPTEAIRLLVEFDAPAADLCAAAAARGPAEPADKSAAAAKRASGKGRAPG